jgi:large-conductance mechanosensitive channel
MIKEFRDLIMRGNVLDLAVAVVIGVAPLPKLLAQVGERNG